MRSVCSPTGVQPVFNLPAALPIHLAGNRTSKDERTRGAATPYFSANLTTK
ncbi:hypothetical protein J6590_031044 [Homalodisca vitripennis]|nr:hypothetical protein J6590_031044 [Homalodisca vitripennis]